jgi:hypothetical protein
MSTENVSNEEKGNGVFGHNLLLNVVQKIALTIHIN